MNAVAVETKIFNFAFPIEDEEMLTTHFDRLESQSTSSFKSAKTALKVLYESIGFKSIADMTADDAKNVIEYLRVMDCMDSSKNQYLLMISSYINAAKKHLFLRGTTILNFFDYIENPFKSKHPSKPETMKIDLSMGKTKDIKALTDDELDMIISAAKFEPKWFYLILLILKHTGMRESEAVSILSENIDLKERVIASGIVKDCRKNYKKNGPVYYILPANLVTEIRSYKLLLKQGEEWLFPGKKPGSHKSKNAIFHDIADFSVKIGIKFTSHQFRHTMVVKRRLMGCPDNDNEFLQNAAPVGLQGKVYRERNIDLAHRRDLFDKWNPYQ